MCGRKRSFPAEKRGKAEDLELESRKSILHMQNQERAYTAASRRSDRSLEARYQSALMASVVHQRRTGKFLRITQEIVANEEMYEEEDNMPPKSRRSSQERIECKAMSQTDARIAAIIATRAGVPNPFQQIQGLVASQLTESISWGPLTTSEPTSNGNSMQPLQQEPNFNPPDDKLDYPNEFNAIGMLQTPGDQNSSIVPYFTDAPLFYDATPLEHKLSITSSISDSPSYDSQFTFETYSEGGSSSTSASSIEMDDFLADFDCESFLNFTQNGNGLGYE